MKLRRLSILLLLFCGACFVYNDELLGPAADDDAASASSGATGASDSVSTVSTVTTPASATSSTSSVGSGGAGGNGATSSSDASTSVSTGSVTEPLWINELHYDNASADVNEGFEVAGIAGTDLTLYSIELYNGSNGTVYTTVPLTGTLPNEQAGYGTKWFGMPADSVQNGSPDGLALVLGGAVVEFLSYEGTFTATAGTANGMLSVSMGGVAETATTPVGQSLQLIGNGHNAASFTWSGPVTATPNAKNAGQTFE